MSLVNPKEKYLNKVEKAVSYNVPMTDSGKVFYATAAGVTFTLPDSSSLADAVEAILDFEYLAHSTIVAADGGGTDVIQYKGMSGASVTLPSAGDSVQLYCRAAGFWEVVAFKGNPTIGGVSLATLNISSESILSIKDGLAVPATTPPAALAQIGTGDGQIECRDFSSNPAVDRLVFPWNVPQDIDVASPVQVQVLGYITAATGPAAGEGVSFAIAGFSIGAGDTLNGAAGAEVNSGYTWAGGGSQYDRFTTGPISITITDLAVKEHAMFKVYRDTADAEDDYAQEIGVYALRITYLRKVEA